MVLIDEIDKTARWSANAVAPTVALLSLLEPENSARWFDSYLQTHCDLSKVGFWATANEIRGLSAPLLSRLRSVYVPAPTSHDFAAALNGMAADLLTEWRLPPAMLDGLDLRSVLRQPLGSLRELRAAVRSALAAWVADGVRRENRH